MFLSVEHRIVLYLVQPGGGDGVHEGPVVPGLEVGGARLVQGTGGEGGRGGDGGGQHGLLAVEDVVLGPGTLLQVVVLPHHQSEDDHDEDAEDDEGPGDDTHQSLDRHSPLVAGLQV